MLIFLVRTEGILDLKSEDVSNEVGFQNRASLMCECDVRSRNFPPIHESPIEVRNDGQWKAKRYGGMSRRKMIKILEKEPDAVFLDPYGQEITHELIYGGVLVNEEDQEFSDGGFDYEDAE